MEPYIFRDWLQFPPPNYSCLWSSSMPVGPCFPNSSTSYKPTNQSVTSSVFPYDSSTLPHVPSMTHWTKTGCSAPSSSSSPSSNSFHQTTSCPLHCLTISNFCPMRFSLSQYAGSLNINLWDFQCSEFFIFNAPFLSVFQSDAAWFPPNYSCKCYAHWFLLQSLQFTSL